MKEEAESRGSLTPTPPEVGGWVQADKKGEIVLFSGIGNQNTPKIILSGLTPFVRFKVNILNKLPGSPSGAEPLDKPPVK